MITLLSTIKGVVSCVTLVSISLATGEGHRQKLYACESYGEMYRTLKDWEKFPPAQKIDVISELVGDLSSRDQTPLVRRSDTVVISRLQKGKDEFHGHGEIVWQDIYLKGGRAAHAIEKLTGMEDLPRLEEGLDDKEWAARVEAIRLVALAYTRGVADATSSNVNKPSTTSPTSQPAMTMFP